MGKNDATNKPKIFGEVGIGLNQLKKDVTEGKDLLNQLSEEAKSLGQSFKDIDIKISIRGTAKNIEGLGEDLKKLEKASKSASDEMKSGMEEAKEKAEELSNVVAKLSHSVKIGSLMPSEAVDSAQKELVKQGYWNKGKDGMYKSATDRYTNERVQLESFIADMTKLEQQADVAGARVLDNQSKEFVRKTVKDLKANLGNLKELYNQGIIDRKTYQKKLDDLEKQATSVMDKNQLLVFQRERTRINKQIEKEVKESADTIQQTGKESTKLYKINLEAELQMQKLRYKNGLINAEEYVAKLKEIYTKAENVMNPNEKVVFAKEMSKVNKDLSASVDEEVKQAKETSRKITQSALDENKILRQSDLTAQKQYLQQVLQNDKLMEEDKITILKRIATLERQINDEKIRDDKKAFNEAKKLNKEYENEMKQLQKELNASGGVNSSMGSAQQRFKSLTNYAYDAGVIYGLINGVKNISNAVKDIEQAGIDLARVMPEVNKYDLKDLRENAFEVGRLTSQNVTDVQKIQNLWARTSDEIAKNSSAMKELTEVTSIGLNVGGFTSAEEAVSSLNGALNQMNLTWQDARMVMDSWIKTADVTAIGTAKDLSEVVTKTGSQAKLLGIDINQLNAITGVLANNMNNSGEEIGTAVKTMLAYMQDEKTIKVLSKYGVEIKKSATEYNNFVDIMQQLEKTYTRLNEANNQKGIHDINEALGRIRRVDYVGTLISNWGEYKDILEESLDSTGYAYEQNEKVMSTYEKKIGQLQVAFQQLAMSIGDSGLLDDLKWLVTSGINLIDWLNNLDPLVKTTLLRFLEFASVMTIVSKSAELLTGTGLGKMLSNSVAWLAYATENQNLLNYAIQHGAVVQTVANTTNTTATGINTVKTASEVAETGAIDVNTIATEENTVAQATLNNTKLAGAGVSSLLTGAISAMLSPIGIATILIVGLTAGLSAYKQSQQKAKEETDKFTEAHKKMMKELKEEVVSEGELPNYQDKVEKLESAYKDYQDKLKKFKEAEKYYQQNKDDTVNSVMASGVLEDATAQLEEAEKALMNLGSSSKTVVSDIEKLNDIITKSNSSVNREAYEVIELIKREQDRNEMLKQSIARYKELQKEVLRTGIQTTEYKRITQLLTNSFPTLKTEIDLTSGAIILNTDAMLSSMGAIGQLTEAQMTELSMYSSLSEVSKSTALGIVENQIAMTKAVINGVEARIQAYKTDIIAMSGDDMTAQALADKWYNLGIKKEVADAKTKLAQLEQTKNLISAIKPLDALNEINEDGNGDVDKFYADIDIKKEKLEKLRDELDLLQGKLDLLEKTEGSSTEKLKIYLQMREKETQIIKELNSLNNDNSNTLARVNKDIDKYIKGWSSMTDDQRVQALQKAGDKTRKSINSLVESYQSLNKEIRENNKSIQESTLNQLEYNDAIADMVESNIKASLQYEKDIANKRLLAQHKMQELALQKEIYGMEQDAFQAQNKLDIEKQQKKLDDLEKEIKDREYINKLKEIEADLDKVLKDTRFAYIDELTGKEIFTYDRAKAKELEQQKTELIQQHQEELDKQAIQDEIERLQKLGDDKAKLYEAGLQKLKEYQQYELDSFNQYWQIRMTDEAIHQSAMDLIKKLGYENALKDSQKNLEDLKKQYEDFQKPMYDAGLSLNQALRDGINKDIDKFIEQQAQEMYNLGKTIKANLNKGIDSISISPIVIPVTYQINSVVSTATGSGSGKTGGYSNTTNVNINKIEANSFDDILDSVRPYITAES